MNFRSHSFLLSHIENTLNFYDKFIDLQGGFYPFYKDDGTYL